MRTQSSSRIVHPAPQAEASLWDRHPCATCQLPGTRTCTSCWVAHELIYAFTLVATGMLLARYEGWTVLVCVEGVPLPMR